MAKEMQARGDIVCGLSAYGIIPPLKQNQHSSTASTSFHQSNIPPLIICGLPASGLIPHHQQPQQEADDDVVELTERQYRRALGYLIRREDNEEDIDPLYRGVWINMRNNARNSSQLRRPKQEKGESSRGKARRR